MIWAFNKIGDWSTKWALGVTFANGAVMVLSALAAALLPYRAKQVYEASPGAKYTVGGTPLVTIVGALGFLLGGFMVVSFLFVEDLGLAFTSNAFPYDIVLGTAAFGLLVYFIMRQVRARPGSRSSTRSGRSRPSSGGRRQDGAGPRPRPILSGETS